jgi:hypothetical protein
MPDGVSPRLVEVRSLDSGELVRLSLLVSLVHSPLMLQVPARDHARRGILSLV